MAFNTPKYKHFPVFQSLFIISVIVVPILCTSSDRIVFPNNTDFAERFGKIFFSTVYVEFENNQKEIEDKFSFVLNFRRAPASTTTTTKICSRCKTMRI